MPYLRSSKFWKFINKPFILHDYSYSKILKRGKNQLGFITIMAFVFLTVIMIFSAVVFDKVRSGLNFNSRSIQQDQSQQIADAAVDYLSYLIGDDHDFDPITFEGDSTLDITSYMESKFQGIIDEIDIGAGQIYYTFEAPVNDEDTFKVNATAYIPDIDNWTSTRSISFDLTYQDTNTMTFEFPYALSTHLKGGAIPDCGVCDIDTKNVDIGLPEYPTDVYSGRDIICTGGNVYGTLFYANNEDIQAGCNNNPPDAVDLNTSLKYPYYGSESTVPYNGDHCVNFEMWFRYVVVGDLATPGVSQECIDNTTEDDNATGAIIPCPDFCLISGVVGPAFYNGDVKVSANTGIIIAGSIFVNGNLTFGNPTFGIICDSTYHTENKLGCVIMTDGSVSLPQTASDTCMRPQTSGYPPEAGYVGTGKEDSYIFIIAQGLDNAITIHCNAEGVLAAPNGILKFMDSAVWFMGAASAWRIDIETDALDHESSLADTGILWDGDLKVGGTDIDFGITEVLQKAWRLEKGSYFTQKYEEDIRENLLNIWNFNGNGDDTLGGPGVFQDGGTYDDDGFKPNPDNDPDNQPSIPNLDFSSNNAMSFDIRFKSPQSQLTLSQIILEQKRSFRISTIVGGYIQFNIDAVGGGSYTVTTNKPFNPNNFNRIVATFDSNQQCIHFLNESDIKLELEECNDLGGNFQLRDSNEDILIGATWVEEIEGTQYVPGVPGYYTQFFKEIIDYFYTYKKVIDVPEYVAPPPTPPDGYWALDNNATDSSGNGHDGTVIGAAPWFNDPTRGLVAKFDGTPGGDQAIDITSADIALAADNGITIDLWFKKSAANYSGEGKTIISKGQCCTADLLEYELIFRPSNQSQTLNSNILSFEVMGVVDGVGWCPNINDAGSGSWYCAEVEITDTNWHHVIGTYNGTSACIFILDWDDTNPQNCIEVCQYIIISEQAVCFDTQTINSPAPEGDKDVTIGALGGSGTSSSWEFDGLIDDIKIFTEPFVQLDFIIQL